MSSEFIDVTDDYDRKDGGESWVRVLDDNTWISVLHRLTGFGYMEWETAICFRDESTGKHREGSPYMIRGDWRDDLRTIAKDELMPWFESKSHSHQTSFQQMMSALRSASNE